MSTKNYFKGNSKKALRILMVLKGVCLSAGTAAYVQDSPKLGFFILVIGALAGEIIQVYSKPEKDEDK